MSDDGFFREVDEELRNEGLRQFWRRFGRFIVAGAVLVVLVVGGQALWTWWDNRESARSGDRFNAAIELIERDQRADGLARLREIEADGNTTYRTLARMRIASVLAEDGKPAEAVALYDAVIGNEEADAEQRSLARIRAAMILVDTGTLADVEARVGSLAVPGGPYRHSAREMLGLASYKAKDLQAAFDQFRTVSEDAEAPAGVRERATLMLDLIASEGGPKRDEAVTGSTTPASPTTPATETTPTTEVPQPATE